MRTQTCDTLKDKNGTAMGESTNIPYRKYSIVHERTGKKNYFWWQLHYKNRFFFRERIDSSLNQMLHIYNGRNMQWESTAELYRVQFFCLKYIRLRPVKIALVVGGKWRQFVIALQMQHNRIGYTANVIVARRCCRRQCQCMCCHKNYAQSKIRFRALITLVLHYYNVHRNEDNNGHV